MWNTAEARTVPGSRAEVPGGTEELYFQWDQKHSRSGKVSKWVSPARVCEHGGAWRVHLTEMMSHGWYRYSETQSKFWFWTENLWEPRWRQLWNHQREKKERKSIKYLWATSLAVPELRLHAPDAGAQIQSPVMPYTHHRYAFTRCSEEFACPN